jgi:hypothetical protein
VLDHHINLETNPLAKPLMCTFLVVAWETGPLQEKRKGNQRRKRKRIERTKRRKTFSFVSLHDPHIVTYPQIVQTFYNSSGLLRGLSIPNTLSLTSL